MDGMGDDILLAHDITASRGFLPSRDPLTTFGTDRFDDDVGAYLHRLDQVGRELPTRLTEGTFRSVADELPSPPADLLDRLTEFERQRLCLLTSFFASGYVHEIGSEPVDRLPAGIAVPLHRVSEHLGRKPIAAYDTICLRNFELIEQEPGFEVENIRPIQRFTDLDDEGWFVAVHVAIEAAAGPALVACARAHEAIQAEDTDTLLEHLRTIADSLEDQTTIMRRMTEGNEPTAFVNEFRPYYQGFNGVVFEGVGDGDGTERTLRGGSGAQSAALPSIDATLGIEHDTTELTEKLDDMRSYVPAIHREAIGAFERGPDVIEYVRATDRDELTAAFNRCVDGIGAFREVHFKQVAQYIRELTDEATGTGGTDYMTFLPKLQRETIAHRL